MHAPQTSRTPNPHAARRAASATRAGALVGAMFAAATFLGAFLLFLVEPLVAKYVLPWFGGGPAVWTACMLFFQAVLLAGYAYAHASVARMTPRVQVGVHVALLLAAVVLALPSVAPAARWQPQPGAARGELSPVWRILALLGATVGLPALALSATSPLLTAWFHRALPDRSDRVHVLYSVSNAGSLLALVAYPLLFEPLMTRRALAVAWSAGLIAFALACVLCALAATRRAAADETASSRPPDGYRPPALHRLLWLLLPTCASVLLLATTNTMTQDVAAVPLLWVLPLALYLLSFVLTFSRRSFYWRPLLGLLLTLSAGLVCWVLFLGDDVMPMAAQVGVLAAALFVCCMVCHGELAALRPPASGLTGYYLTIAAGGALGGLLVAVVAPLLLSRYVELHVGLWACCALALVVSQVTPGRVIQGQGRGLVGVLSIAGLALLAVVLWAAGDRYLRDAKPIFRGRDFYGVVTLYAYKPDSPDRSSLLLHHAGVTHGRQFTAPGKRRLPTTYYTPGSGVGVALAALHAGQGKPLRVGAVGLGAGTVAAYGRPGDAFRFYELAPSIVRLARERFTFLADSPARCETILGDARLSLEREPAQGFDLLVLDAFSGDAVPVHLLTAEAFDLYRRHVAPGGVIAAHVSNHYLDLAPVVARQAERIGWGAMVVTAPNGDDLDGGLASDWVLLTTDAAKLNAFRRAGAAPAWVDAGVPLWTDEYASLLRVLR